MYNRDFTVIVNWILDNILPPIIRDNKIIMSLIMRPIYGKYTKKLFDFKEKFPILNQRELKEYYDEIKDAPINLHRQTDLNTKCIRFILDNIKMWGGGTILDAAAGRGYLANLLVDDAQVIAMDIIIPDKRNEKIQWRMGDLQDIPFSDDSFEIVICTHAIEHIREYRKVINELKRVSKNKVIIVMPCQREYKYTVDLHINFCPYLYKFKEFIGESDAEYYKIGGDWVCIINV